MLYNGVEPYPDTNILRLSDLFADPSILGILPRDLSPLELVVKVYNINEGKNAEILQRCETLQGYSVFVARTREFAADLAGNRKLGELSNDEREEAMRRAITWRIDHGILKSFLEIHGSEVRNMLFDEWKLEEALVVEREEGREEGLEQGRAEGREEGLERGLERGREEGREEGLEQGREEGLERGRAEGEAKGLERGREEGLEEGLERGLEQGHAEAVINLLDFGMMPDEVSRMLKLPLETVLRYQAQ